MNFISDDCNLDKNNKNSNTNKNTIDDFSNEKIKRNVLTNY